MAPRSVNFIPPSVQKRKRASQPSARHTKRAVLEELTISNVNGKGGRKGAM